MRVSAFKGKQNLTFTTLCIVKLIFTSYFRNVFQFITASFRYIGCLGFLKQIVNINVLIIIGIVVIEVAVGIGIGIDTDSEVKTGALYYDTVNKMRKAAYE
ncbi:MAG: hypothetical protein JW915_07100 [Chitinispirillaceae bacterium]|nr:hypothetical protein [Chitinispirillaceae bacterium]